MRQAMQAMSKLPGAAARYQQRLEGAQKDDFQRRLSPLQTPVDAEVTKTQGRGGFFADTGQERTPGGARVVTMASGSSATAPPPPEPEEPAAALADVSLRNSPVPPEGVSPQFSSLDTLQTPPTSPVMPPSVPSTELMSGQLSDELDHAPPPPVKETTMQRMKRLAAEAKATAAARFASKPSSKPAGPKASERFRAAAMDFHRRASESMAALREKKKAPEKPVQRKPAFASPVATDPASPSANCFSIGDDEEGDELDYQSPQSTPPRPKKEPVPLTAAEQESLALAQHRIAGLTKGDEVIFDADHLPDTILFMAIKLKPNKTAAKFGLSSVAERKLLRCVGVNRERLLVFDTFGETVKLGSKGRVKSNHHLTELVKLTFPRARERDVVALHIRAGMAGADDLALKANVYKVPRAESMIAKLQERLAKFR